MPPTAADRAMAENPTAFLLCFTRDNAYRDGDVPAYGRRGTYKGQNRLATFDQLIRTPAVRMVLVHQDASNGNGDFYTIKGRCTNRAYNAGVRDAGDIPTCTFVLRPDHGIVARQVAAPVAQGVPHCWRKKFLYDHNLRKVSGGIGNGIMLVVAETT